MTVVIVLSRRNELDPAQNNGNNHDTIIIFSLPPPPAHRLLLSYFLARCFACATARCAFDALGEPLRMAGHLPCLPAAAK